MQHRQDEIIIFLDINAEGVQILHDDAIVVFLTIVKYDVKHVLIDNGRLQTSCFTMHLAE